MILRLLLVLALVLPPVLAAMPSAAQSPMDFLRKQERRERYDRRQRRAEPPPAPAEPAQPVQPQTNAPASGAPAASTTTAPPRNTPPPPYEKDMRRMGEILGALHYLRPLCGADDGLVWRTKMQDLIEAEGGPPDRRERLAGAFNHGYSSFQLTYRTCTPAADLVVRRYLAEGAKLARAIATGNAN